MNKKEKQREYNRLYYEKNKEKIKNRQNKNRARITIRHNKWSKENKEYITTYMRAWRHGLTVDQMNLLLEQAGDNCPICNRGFDESVKAIDHCHETGTIRGVICNKCNVAIGMFGESVDALKNSIDYLERHK